MSHGSPSLVAFTSIGLAAGFLSGLLGVGGGVFIVPMLVLVARLPQHSAHATSLGAVVPIAVAGSLFFGVRSHVDIGIALLLAAGTLFGAPLGARFMAGLEEATLKIGFGTLLVVVGMIMVLR